VLAGRYPNVNSRVEGQGGTAGQNPYTVSLPNCVALPARSWSGYPSPGAQGQLQLPYCLAGNCAPNAVNTLGSKPPLRDVPAARHVQMREQVCLPLAQLQNLTGAVQALHIRPDRQRVAGGLL